MNQEDGNGWDISFVEPDLADNSDWEVNNDGDSDSDSSGPKLDDTPTLLGLSPADNPDPVSENPISKKCTPKTESTVNKNPIFKKFRPKVMSTPTKKNCGASNQNLHSVSTKPPKSEVHKTPTVKNNIMKNFLKSTKKKQNETGDKKPNTEKEMNKPIEIGQCPLCFHFLSMQQLPAHASSCEGGSGGSDAGQVCGHCSQGVEEDMQQHVADCIEEIKEKKKVQEILERKGTLRMKRKRKVDKSETENGCEVRSKQESNSQAF